MGKQPKCRDEETHHKEKKGENSKKRELIEIKASNLPDTEFKTLIIRMLKELRERINQLSKNFSKNIINIEIHGNQKKKESEIKKMQLPK